MPVSQSNTTQKAAYFKIIYVTVYKHEERLFSFQLADKDKSGSLT